MRQGEIENTRADVDFHHPFFQGLVAKLAAQPNSQPLAAFLAAPLVTGFAAGKGDRATEGTEAVLQIRPTQMLPGGTLHMSEAYAIPAEGIKAGDIIQPGEVLFNNTNSTQWVGKTVLFDGYSVPVVCSNHVTRLRVRQGVEPVYVEAALNTLQGLGYFARLCTNFNNQAGVNNDALHTVRLPLPPLPVQQELVAAMNTARARRQQQLAEAEALLGGFDTYLLATLGIEAPASDGRRVFGIRAADAFQKGRINPEYFHPERLLTLRAIEQAGVRHERLGNLVDFIRQQIKTPGEKYLSLGHVQSQTGELVESSEKSEGSCFTFEAGDVLFMRLRPYLNKVYLAEFAGCCSPEFHVLRVRDEAAIHADYLAVALRSKLMLLQTVHMMTGNTHPRLANEDVPDLILPVPPLAVQAEIVAEVQRRRAQARQLREAAETGWAAARAAFEARLLGS